MGRRLAQRVDRQLRKHTLHADGRTHGGHYLGIQRRVRAGVAATPYLRRQPHFGISSTHLNRIIMKPIQEYTKQEKLEAILEYNPCRVRHHRVGTALHLCDGA